MTTNPERDQDRAADLYDNWVKYGYVMFPQQAEIYHHLAKVVDGKLVLEAGCGAGVGTAVLSRKAAFIRGTDKSQRNTDFARDLYPWLTFDVWDISNPWMRKQYDVVIAVEVIEHVANPVQALANLIAAATETVWVSTPNGRGKDCPPDNPYHVYEYAPDEFVSMLGAALMVTPTRHKVRGIRQFHWQTFEPVSVDTDVSPLVYKVEL